MKFNPNCVRDILLTAQDVITDKVHMEIESPSDYERLKDYSFSEIAYHIQQCREYELLEYKEDVLGGYTVSKILPNGNELIGKFENESVWKKAVAKGIFSIPSMISVVNSAFDLFSNITSNM